MISAEFRSVARALQPYIRNTYDLLNAVDAVMGVVVPDPDTHEGRVQIGLNSSVVIDFLRAGQKINAIKQLRALASCGLKEAKDATEDSRLDAYYNRPSY
jgi:ribosomal protein L7/L12